MIPSGTFGGSPESLPCENVGRGLEEGRSREDQQLCPALIATPQRLDTALVLAVDAPPA